MRKLIAAIASPFAGYYGTTLWCHMMDWMYGALHVPVPQNMAPVIIGVFIGFTLIGAWFTYRLLGLFRRNAC